MLPNRPFVVLWKCYIFVRWITVDNKMLSFTYWVLIWNILDHKRYICWFACPYDLPTLRSFTFCVIEWESIFGCHFIAGLHEHLLKRDTQNKKNGSSFDIYLEISWDQENLSTFLKMSDNGSTTAYTFPWQKCCQQKGFSISSHPVSDFQIICLERVTAWCFSFK